MVKKSRKTVKIDGETDWEDVFLAKETELIVIIGIDGNISDNVRNNLNFDYQDNNSIRFSIICSDNNLEELVVGRIFSDGIISGADKIKSIETHDKKKLVKVKVREVSSQESKIFVPVKVDEKVVFSLAKVLFDDLPVHSYTKGTHCCFLSDSRGNILFSCEDISRYNSIDKAIGFAILRRLSMSELILITSGRVSELAVKKVIKAGIQVLISKSAPSNKAVELAKKYNVKLICRAYPDQFDLYE